MVLTKQRSIIKMTDNNIITAYKANPAAGFKLLLGEYQEKIYWHIRRLVVTHEDAEDVMQETFIKIFKSLDTFRGDSSLATWLYRIATNESIRLLRKQRPETLAQDDDGYTLADKLEASEYVDYDDETAVRFQKAILSLPDKQRIVFNLRYYDELTYEQIANITGDKVNTLKVNYHIAKEKIKTLMINS